MIYFLSGFPVRCVYGPHPSLHVAFSPCNAKGSVRFGLENVRSDSIWEGCQPRESEIHHIARFLSSWWGIRDTLCVKGEFWVGMT